MRRNEHLAAGPRTRATLLAFIASLTLVAGAIHAQPGRGAPDPSTDILTTKDGKSISGTIGSMRDGKIHLTTGQGPTSVEVDSVADFTLRRGGEGGRTEESIDPQTIDEILANQLQILQRLDSLAITVANLERQLRGVQTNQVVQSRRITEQGVEKNPLSKIVVTKSNLRRSNRQTFVIGQVMNLSETVMTHLQVQATLIGSQGEFRRAGGVLSNSAAVIPQSLAPGQTGSFEITFNGSYSTNDVRVNIVGNPGNFQVPAPVFPPGFGNY